MTDSDLHRASVVTVEVGGLAVAPPPGAALRVRVLDDSLADAAHHVIASAEVPDWDGSTMQVRLDVPGWQRARRTVFAHAGATADIRPGDWITTTSFPVDAADVRVRLDRVG